MWEESASDPAAALLGALSLSTLLCPGDSAFLHLITARWDRTLQPTLSEPSARWVCGSTKLGPTARAVPTGGRGGWARGCTNKKEPQKLRSGQSETADLGLLWGLLRRNVAGARPGRGARRGTKGDGFPQPSCQHNPLRPPGGTGEAREEMPVPSGVLRGEGAAGSAASPGTSPGAPPRCGGAVRLLRLRCGS